MDNKSRRNKVIFCILICTLILVGFLGTYAFFISIGNNDKLENLSANAGNMALTFSDGTSSFQGDLEFGKSATKSFTIENTGSLEVKGRMKWNNLVNTYLEGSLTYTLSYSETEEGEYIPIIENRNVPTSSTEVTKTLAPELVIPVGQTYYYKLVITLNYLTDVDQTADLNAILTTEFSLEEANGKADDFLEASELTLSQLNLKAKIGKPIFVEASTNDETADGLYAMEDDYGTSYYFRGSVENNYVKFAGFWWRIIRINGDGSLRIIYDGSQGYSNGTGDVGRVALTSIVWNTTNYGDAKFVGYMYGGNNASNSSTKRVELDKDGYKDSTNAIYNETDTNIKIQLEDWYKTNIADKNLDQYVSDTLFCNDRSIAEVPKTWWSEESDTPGYGKNKTAYGAFGRLRTISLGWSDTPNPQFICPNKNDAFTKSDTEKGNGKLGEKIGFITVDEVVAAGSGKGEVTNSNYYLYKGRSYWSFSPNIFNGVLSYIFSVGTDGDFNISSVQSMRSVAPVINLSPEYVSTLKGTGIIGDEYEAK